MSQCLAKYAGRIDMPMPVSRSGYFRGPVYSSWLSQIASDNTDR